MDPHTQTNRKYWDQLARIHPKTAFYRLDDFKRGENILDPIVREALGEVAGKRLLHLQCHFGLDSLSLARLGADVTGLDLSPVAIETARELSANLEIPATFVEADVLHAPDDLRGFDIVFASWGALCWISDLATWMRTASHALKPGGRLILIDGHPTGMMLDLEAEAGAPLRVRYPYDSPEPDIEEGQGSYADESAILDDPRCVVWGFGLESLITAMFDAGLALRSFRELDRVAWPMSALVKADEYYWKLPDSVPYVPLGFALTAERTS
jgi:SAM-dependent methyltransferase